MRLYSLALTTVLFLSAGSATAGIFGNSVFLEPSIGYRSEKVQFTDLNSASSDVRISTPSFGLKFGYRSAIGIDVNLAGEYATGKAELSPQNDKADFSHQSLAVQIGVNSRGLIKVFLGSTLFNELEVKELTSQPAFKLAGPAFQAGLQFNILPFLSIGGQYTLNQFDTIKGAAYANDSRVDSYYNKLDTQDYQIYISTSL
ncbi:hypothetical protein [Pseudobdellovibrio exovorus]|uniref:Outer membrane protein beta-barrel domain-containing protein n=1 Tax=Pseudobdellovibrio exovorus JSS TaxID=1184267 RepID=M4VB72_9BACT|nr:hypothetical protein [Pseudobdellovibrio exovorus]AGH95271.1 hypothetical protein A11Q_1055 [Pseudobdellovibrio exovorus JSS]